MTSEDVVLLDPGGAAVGTAPKAAVHHLDTPLHLAFSCYLVDAAGRVLLTRRALHKPTWPGVWTNSCCGHPLPGEPMEAAVRRRLGDELGTEVGAVDLVLPGFAYRAVMANGVVENELCPVYRARATGDLRPDAGEVAAVRWLAWADMVAAAADPGEGISPWFRAQVAELVRLGDDPRHWPVADDAGLPAAARPSPPG
ncbi:MAG TPA: isopentenyl-diphosphate Delta-isomerase [Acidimicrobiales bacterium]|nr:isopentenyl-diphosphate Delta-isomerase [Acidimicrobiales bacterium]